MCNLLGSEDMLFCSEQRWLVIFHHRGRNTLGTFQKTVGRRGCWISTRIEETPQARYRYLEWLRIMRWWQPECVKMMRMDVKMDGKNWEMHENLHKATTKRKRNQTARQPKFGNAHLCMGKLRLQILIALWSSKLAQVRHNGCDYWTSK